MIGQMLPQKSLAPDRKPETHFLASAQPCSRPDLAVFGWVVQDKPANELCLR
jgi:hypothetical protein